MRFGNSGQSGKGRNHPNVGIKKAKSKLQLGHAGFTNKGEGANRVML